MNLEKPKKIQHRVWARNKVCITLLRHFGLRASDIREITMFKLKNGIKTGTMQIAQPKTKKQRVIVFTDSAISDLQKIEQELKIAFGYQLDRPLAYSIVTGKLIPCRKWVNQLNLFIKLANKKFAGIFTSHSFRINYVTKLLKILPIQQVQSIVGHKDISTTKRYDRFRPDASKMKEIITKALNEKIE
uniref:Putative integrase n=1 Tax=Roya anglica TaxID=43943 RepID=A0A6G9IG72_9VIRI|nr:putative integrase [Roya anglica]QIQ22958.1 putative integrase [Roya anglica]